MSKVIVVGGTVNAWGHYGDTEEWLLCYETHRCDDCPIRYKCFSVREDAQVTLDELEAHQEFLFYLKNMRMLGRVL